MPALKLPESIVSFITSFEAVKALPAVEDAYRMGRDYQANGPNQQNCYFRLFATPDHTRAWEKGKADAAAGK